MNQLIKKVQEQVKSVIVGKDEVVSKVLMAILAQGNVLLEDVPGVGKTTMAMTFAKTLGLDTKRIQFTPDTMPSDIIGFSVYDKNSEELQYKEGAIMTNILLADEINRTSSKTQSALLEAMEEKKITIDGTTHELPDPFVVLATQNPVGSAGTQMLPNSQLDRFIIKLSMGYPDLASQVDILRERHTGNPLNDVEAVIDIDEVRKLIEDAGKVFMTDELFEYVATLIEKTRGHSMLSLGVSPRGALALCKMSKAHAFVKGRDYVVPNDIQSVFGDVCSHRLILNSKARLNEYTESHILDEILNDVEMPVVDEVKEKIKKGNQETSKA